MYAQIILSLPSACILTVSNRKQAKPSKPSELHAKRSTSLFHSFSFVPVTPCNWVDVDHIHDGWIRARQEVLKGTLNAKLADMRAVVGHNPSSDDNDDFND
jgi:hypothetical protein